MSWKIFGKNIFRFHHNNYSMCITRINNNHQIKLSKFTIFRHYLCEGATANNNNNNNNNNVKNKSTHVIATIQKQFQEKTFNSSGETHHHSSENERKSALRSMKYTFMFLGVSLFALSSYVILILGQPKRDEENAEIILTDEYSALPIWKQYLLRGLNQVQKFALFIQEPSRDKLLPDPLTYPYYQPAYTLVLEFTDVLAHPEWTYQSGWRFKKRPGVDYLLENLAGLYEIVVFTAEPGMTIFPVIEALDQKGLISYKLVRDSTHFIDGHHVKNLDRMNRDLKKVIVIDWNNQSVKFHSDNLFNIGRWTGADEDDTLLELANFLKIIAQNDIDDVRDVLKFYKQFEDPLNTFKQKQIEYLEKQQKIQENSTPQPKESMKRFLNLIL